MLRKPGQRLVISGRGVYLSHLESKVFTTIVAARGRTVTYEEIEKTCGAARQVLHNTLHHLRPKIEPEYMILSNHGIGYFLYNGGKDA